MLLGERESDFIKLCTLASSSSGNCALISHGKTHLLVDAGISLKRITTGLKEHGLSVDDLTGVLITHEHSDHISGVKMLVKYHKTPLFAPHRVAAGLGSCVPEAQQTITCFEAGGEFVLGEIAVGSFTTPHDTPESVGYRFFAGNASLVFVTDFGVVTKEILDAAIGADMAVLESNHDVTMLKNGPYPAHLKRRVLSDRGHLSNNDCSKLASRLMREGTRRILLAHLSKENNTPALAYETVRRALVSKGGTVGGDVFLETAPADTMSATYNIGQCK